ncbi:MAG: Druantia anti-phage system protein DruA [Chthoniobacterales bacterium]
MGWEVNFKTNKVLITPPASYDKQVVRDSMQIKRQASLSKHAAWIKEHAESCRENLADGNKVWESRIEPIIEVCKTQEQLNLFRCFRFYWSSPYSEYVGRRIKLLIRDKALAEKPLIGIAALGSSIVHIPDRDLWVKWDTQSRTKNLVYTMDAYVLGALPPYNHVLGGKLISYLMASKEIRKIFQEKYKGKITSISQRKANRLACIFTTSLYGKSSQYNRVKYNGDLVYIPIGHTRGYGTLHLADETFEAMRDLLKSRNILVPNRFGDGPVWRMRVIRTAAELLNFDSDFLLKHSFQRAIYAVPLAKNAKEFLQGRDSRLRYFNYSLADLTDHWKKRWLTTRNSNPEVHKKVAAFFASDFKIE